MANNWSDIWKSLSRETSNGVLLALAFGLGALWLASKDQAFGLPSLGAFEVPVVIAAAISGLLATGKMADALAKSIARKWSNFRYDWHKAMLAHRADETIKNLSIEARQLLEECRRNDRAIFYRSSDRDDVVAELLSQDLIRFRGPSSGGYAFQWADKIFERACIGDFQRFLND